MPLVDGAAARGGRDSAVRRLYEKAKRRGDWNPADIDLRSDAADWRCLPDPVRRLLLRATAVFSVGEEAVTRDLLPYAALVAREGRLDDELFVSAWLREEEKHTDFFLRFVAGVAPESGDLSPLLTVGGRRIFEEELPRVMSALHADGSPPAQVRALVTYCLVVEGLMAETGHAVLGGLLADPEVMPGLRRGLALVRRDESRHVAYGMHTLCRLLRFSPESRRQAWNQVNRLAGILESSETLATDRTAPAGTMARYVKARDRLGRRLRGVEVRACGAA